jgi:hypothetical protein
MALIVSGETARPVLWVPGLRVAAQRYARNDGGGPPASRVIPAAGAVAPERRNSGSAAGAEPPPLQERRFWIPGSRFARPGMTEARAVSRETRLRPCTDIPGAEEVVPCPDQCARISASLRRFP